MLCANVELTAPSSFDWRGRLHRLHGLRGRLCNLPFALMQTVGAACGCGARTCTKQATLLWNPAAVIVEKLRAVALKIPISKKEADH